MTEKKLCPREHVHRGIRLKVYCAAFILGACNGEPEKLSELTCMHTEEAKKKRGRS
jgi:hypothetical protein